jgi:hypothetical protein
VVATATAGRQTMTNTALAAVMDRFMNDPTFRDGMVHSPEETLRTSRMALSEEDVAAVLNTDWAHAGEELDARISKGLISN